MDGSVDDPYAQVAESGGGIVEEFLNAPNGDDESPDSPPDSVYPDGHDGTGPQPSPEPEPEFEPESNPLDALGSLAIGEVLIEPSGSDEPEEPIDNQAKLPLSAYLCILLIPLSALTLSC